MWKFFPGRVVHPPTVPSPPPSPLALLTSSASLPPSCTAMASTPITMQIVTGDLAPAAAPAWRIPDDAPLPLDMLLARYRHRTDAAALCGPALEQLDGMCELAVVHRSHGLPLVSVLPSCITLGGPLPFPHPGSDLFVMRLPGKRATDHLPRTYLVNTEGGATLRYVHPCRLCPLRVEKTPRKRRSAAKAASLLPENSDEDIVESLDGAQPLRVDVELGEDAEGRPTQRRRVTLLPDPPAAVADPLPAAAELAPPPPPSTDGREAGEPAAAPAPLEPRGAQEPAAVPVPSSGDPAPPPPPSDPSSSSSSSSPSPPVPRRPRRPRRCRFIEDEAEHSSSSSEAEGADDHTSIDSEMADFIVPDDASIEEEEEEPEGSLVSLTPPHEE